MLDHTPEKPEGMDEERFRQGLVRFGAEITEEQRLLLVTLDLNRVEGAAAGEGQWDPAAGVNAILQTAAEADYALRRLRRRPVSLADEFYDLVEA